MIYKFEVVFDFANRSTLDDLSDNLMQDLRPPPPDGLCMEHDA